LYGAIAWAASKRGNLAFEDYFFPLKWLEVELIEVVEPIGTVEASKNVKVVACLRTGEAKPLWWQAALLVNLWPFKSF
jgi:hypothetical protein